MSPRDFVLFTSRWETMTVLFLLENNLNTKCLDNSILNLILVQMRDICVFVVPWEMLNYYRSDISVTRSPFSRIFITKILRQWNQAECRSMSLRKIRGNLELYLYSLRRYDHNRKHVTARHADESCDLTLHAFASACNSRKRTRSNVHTCKVINGKT